MSHPSSSDVDYMFTSKTIQCSVLACTCVAAYVICGYAKQQLWWRYDFNSSNGVSQATRASASSGSKAANKRNGDENESRYSLDKEITDYVQKADEIESSYLEFYPGAERIHYDFAAERKHLVYTTNLPETIINMVKGCLGVGILLIHEGFKNGGIWTSLILTLVLGFFISYIMLMLVQSAQKMCVRLRVPRLSYGELIEVAVATGHLKCCRKFSKCIRYSVDMLLFIELCSLCCIYQLMIAHTLKKALEEVSTKVQELNLDTRIYIITITIPLLVLCLMRRLKYYSPFTVIGDIFLTICIIITVCYSISSSGNIRDRPAWKDVQGLFRLTGVAIFSIEGVGLALPVENSMRHPTDFRFVVMYAMTFVTLYVTAVGFFGYWGIGELSTSPITIHMPVETGPIILQFLMAIVWTFAFAVRFWVPFRILWAYLGRRFKRNRGLWERLFRLLHVVVITGLTVMFPKALKMMTLMGNVFIGAVTFIFPPFIETVVDGRSSGLTCQGQCCRNIKNILLVMFGLVLCLGGFCSTFDN